MWSYIAGGVFLVLAIYLIVQGIRCGIAVRESKDRLAAYNVRTAALSYGDMTYVDSGSGEVILSVHGIFGGYDQAYDTCKDFCSDYRIIAPSRFGYLGSDVYGDGTPAEQAAAYSSLRKAKLPKPEDVAVTGLIIVQELSVREVVDNMLNKDVITGLVFNHTSDCPYI